MEKHTYDMKPPQDISWHMGKTPNSIRFVQEAEKYISQHTEDIEAIGSLRSMVEKVKQGQIMLFDFLAPVEFLKNSEMFDNIYLEVVLEANEFFTVEEIKEKLITIGAGNVEIIAPNHVFCKIRDARHLMQIVNIEKYKVKSITQIL